MNKGTALIGGVGLGAALMYFFDPDRGKRRRALVRDKVEAAGHKVEDVAGKVSRDLCNRCYGMMVETKSFFKHEEVSDEVLVDRVRAKLGRYPVHLGAINVTAHDGTVTLRGQILADEMPRVLRGARVVRGVKGIDNQLEVHATAGDVPALQGTPQPLGAQG
jgi:osmotically-inducible protein OsmY